MFFMYVLTFIAFCSGCGQNFSKTYVDNIGIRGIIKHLQLSEEKKIISLYVEGIIEEDTDYDKANITMTDKCKIIRKDTKEKLSEDELKIGAMVEVIFDGPVSESYPVQAKAKEIRILRGSD